MKIYKNLSLSTLALLMPPIVLGIFCILLQLMLSDAQALTWCYTIKNHAFLKYMSGSDVACGSSDAMTIYPLLLLLELILFIYYLIFWIFIIAKNGLDLYRPESYSIIKYFLMRIIGLLILLFLLWFAFNFNIRHRAGSDILNDLLNTPYLNSLAIILHGYFLLVLALGFIYVFYSILKGGKNG